jgi:hypothetical protein
MSDTIPILVDAPAGTVMRGGAAEKATTHVVNVTAEFLKERMGNLARILSDAAESAPKDTPFEVTEVRFTIHVDLNGEVSVMSLAKGAVTTGAGIEVTLTKRAAKP